MLPTDPRTLTLMARLDALRADAAVSVADARLAVAETNARLRSSRATLAPPASLPLTSAT